MELTNDFRVNAPVEEAWKVLTDVERIAPCMPGAQLQEVEGDEYRGIVKVKVGPITAQYKGAATFVEKDDSAHRAVLRADGRDTRGQGNASAMITATLVEDGGGTKVTVVTDLTVTGKVAQFGRGVMADVSEKLLGQFVKNLEARVLSQDRSSGSTPAGGSGGTGSADPAVVAAPASTGGAGASGTPDAPSASAGRTSPPSPPPAAAPPAAGSGAPSAGSAPASTPTSTPTPTSTSTSGTGGGPAATNGSPTAVRKITPVEPVEPVELLGATGAPLAKRLAPVAGLVLVLWVLARLRRRRH
jgi:uncharacterized protein